MEISKFDLAFKLFDKYNSKDPKTTMFDGQEIPNALLYAQRMTDKLNEFEPNASEHLKLATHCQHIGRWEIPRKNYPIDRKGYLYRIRACLVLKDSRLFLYPPWTVARLPNIWTA